ncbi:MAG TPA: FAD binding domain-containing protein [Candidatus Binatus sp.]|nr:FAD binding domain-containing protein [Candidatus Binatus sp.]
MIPAPFEYLRAGSLDEALGLLAASEGETRPIAGGQSLLPLMKLRLARPERLVDIGRLGELRGVRCLPDGRLAVGALTTWSELLADGRVMAYGVLRDAIPTIGDVAIRNRGTIGGSLAHADPAADIAAPSLALDAELVVRSTAGERIVPATELFVGPFTTSLRPAEVITEVRLPAGLPDVGSAYVAISHPASGYPSAGAAAVLGPSRRGSGSWDICCLALTGVGERPYRATGAEQAVLSGASFADAVASIAAGQRLLVDPYADRAYRAAMASLVARRALELAARRAAGQAAEAAPDPV